MGLLSSIGKAIGKVGSALTSSNVYASLGSAAIGALSQKSSNKQMMNYNAQEAELARQFNAAEAEKSRQFSKKEAEIARQFNASESAKTRQWQEEMWKKQQAYDTPENQLKRLQEAGINPSILGQDLTTSAGVPSASASATSPMPSAPSASGPAAAVSSIPNPALAASQAALVLAQAKNVESNTSRTKQLKELDAMLANSTIQSNNSTIQLQESMKDVNKKTLISIDKTIEKMDKEISVMGQQLSYIDEQKKLIAEDRKAKQAYNKRIDEIVNYQVEQMIASINATKANTGLTLENIDQVRQSIKNLVAAEEGQKTQNKVIWYQWKFQNHTFKTSVDLTNVLNRKGYEQAKFYIDNKGAYNWTNLLGYMSTPINQTIQSAADVFSSVATGGKAAGIFGHGGAQ